MRAASALASTIAALFLLALAGCSATPPELTLSGDLAAHDPALVAHADGGDWYVYSTGSAAGDGNIQIRSSPDGRDWSYVGEVWPNKPDWIVATIPGVTNLWAPDLTEHDGTWYLYYAASTFGSNHSVIALATNTTLDPNSPDYRWVDRGPVLESQKSDDFNAIDPGVAVDADGDPWMAFGSFWSGIRMVPLHWSDGKLADEAEPLRLADRLTPPNAIEGASIIAHDGWYYLFVSRDSCCRGVHSTYNMAVGRSQQITGPYEDRDGVSMLANGGTILLATDGSVIGPGGESASGGYLAFHYYDGDNGGATHLEIRPITWGPDGWPSIG
ncbi:MAG: arabinan endo-1,5-alpha-L-arabinosidase [Rhodoglobus sp.]